MQSLFKIMKERRLGASPQNIFGITPFQSKEKTIFDIERALQKGHFRTFAKKVRGPDPQDALGCAPGYSKIEYTMHQR